MVYFAADDRYEKIEYARVGQSGLKIPRISLGLWNNFGDDRPLTTQRAILLPRLRPRRDPLRPGQQLRPSRRQRGEQLRPHPRVRPAALPRRARHLEQGRLRHVARAVRRVGLAQVPAVVARPVARRGWGSTTSTSSTRTVPTPRRRSRRRWARSRPPCGRARRSTPASRTTTPSRPSPPRTRSPPRGCRCSSTSRGTTCSTARWKTACSTRSRASASAASSSPRSPRAC